MKRASIIIPTFNRLDLLIRCVASIRNYTDIPHEIIVVDNGSTDGTADWCRMAGVTLLSLNRNEGFPVACNRGLKISSGDTLVLLNNDTVVSPRWLSNMSLALYSAADIGIVGPITNYASGPQQVELTYPDIDSFILLADAVNRSDPHKWVPIQRIVGVCFVFRRELMEKIGLLDERFSPDTMRTTIIACVPNSKAIECSCAATRSFTMKEAPASRPTLMPRIGLSSGIIRFSRTSGKKFRELSSDKTLEGLC
ncbi:glycosyltransferase family 2 protein [Cohnella faecalis]|uniref:glycosyltransferase family 2 protein n=1 Tax=Cohnella faecalis TaxID=2315694 RepID=UPI0026BBC4A8|nr:glycosyltransferase family 2 protein [Cohnella faecalis]